MPRETDRTRWMSPRGEALMRLQRRARSARIVMSADVRAYLHHTMGQRRQIAASELPIGSIKEFRIVQTLASYAQEANTRLACKHGGGESKKLPGYKFAPTPDERSEEHTSELQSLMRISYAVFCLKKTNLFLLLFFHLSFFFFLFYFSMFLF